MKIKLCVVFLLSVCSLGGMSKESNGKHKDLSMRPVVKICDLMYLYNARQLKNTQSLDVLTRSDLIAYAKLEDSTVSARADEDFKFVSVIDGKITEVYKNE